jgi:HEAT repeat protein
VAVLLIGLALVQPAAAVDPIIVAEDEQVLKTAKLGIDGPSLLAFFRTRTKPDLDQERIAALVRQLGNDSDKISSEAQRQLLSLGSVAVPWLRRALKDPDEALTATRAKFCLEAIEGGSGTSIPVSAARLIGLRRPEGAAGVLLAYLPFADDDTVADEVRDALTALASDGGKPDPALVAALKDPVPVRRAAAAEALCQAGVRAEFPAVRYLLQDPKPTVRLKAALALAAVKDRESIPVLIDSLGKLAKPQAQLAEEALIRIAGVQAPSVPVGTDEAGRKRCRDTWATWWQSVKDADLIEYFRKRTLADADREKFLSLIKLLGSDSYRTRQKVAAQLVAYRSAAVPLLLQATKDRDPEIASRAERCLATINAAPGAGMSAANARLISFRKPRGAVTVLLGYLPYADDESVGEEVRNSLAALALPEGKPHPSLLAALSDRSPARRATAAEALLLAGARGQKAALARLLKDPETPVRMRVAMALANARDRSAVPVLIDLLTQLPEDEGWKAEEVLRRLADDKAPKLVLAGDAATRQKCRDAWAAWWKDHGTRIDMARMDNAPRLLGYTVIAQYGNNGVGQVFEIGKDGKSRWQIDGLNYAFDVQILRGDRVLIPEYNGSRVTERDFKGKILWELKCYSPINAQRLPNGNTFVASRNVIMEVDRNKKELYSIKRQYDVMAAQKLRNGQIVMISNTGMCIRMDTKGKEIKSFSVGNVSYYGGLEALPNNHILVAQYNNNKVVEYDADGKSVWETTVQWPTTASRLPNGHTLIASQDTQQILEVDRNGKKVWEYKTSGRPWRVRRR